MHQNPNHCLAPIHQTNFSHSRPIPTPTHCSAATPPPSRKATTLSRHSIRHLPTHLQPAIHSSAQLRQFQGRILPKITNHLGIFSNNLRRITRMRTRTRKGMTTTLNKKMSGLGIWILTWSILPSRQLNQLKINLNTKENMYVLLSVTLKSKKLEMNKMKLWN